MDECYNCFKPRSTSGPCPNCGYDPAGEREKYPLALRPGSILNGRYIVGRVLGQGGFGITYIALDDQRQQRVAIKEYLPTEFAGRTFGSYMVSSYSADREENFRFGKERFLEEAKTLAAFIGDEHIVRIYSYFEENGTAYFAMEYVEGMPLDKYMATKGGRLTVEEADELLLPLMEALDVVHSKGIVHRDIAPDNIIITPEHTAKLLDFGAARYSTGEKSKSLDIVIKHGFAPYEQYMRRGRQGPFTDVYAMAATYYYAITGKVLPDAVERRSEDTMVPPSTLGVKINDKAEAALDKALEVTYADRFQTMGAFRDALYAAGEETRKKKEQERLEREAAEKEREAEEEARKQKERQEEEAAEKARAEQERLEREAASVQTGRKEPEPSPLPGEATVDSPKSPTGKKKRFTALWACLAAVAVIAAGYFTIHIWEPATCTEPETCRICGTTRGQALGHDCLPATCTEPKTCAVCGETFGAPLGHMYLPATHKEPATCTRCGAQTGLPKPKVTQLAGTGFFSVGRLEDGSMVSTYGDYAFSQWKDVVSVAGGVFQVIGLKSDGTCLALNTLNEDIYPERAQVNDWSGIIEISAGDEHSVGLRSDGTVVAVGHNQFGQCNVSKWNGITHIAAGYYHTVGLHPDGTVTATGSNTSGQRNVGKWKNIIAIAAGGEHTVGLRADGTVVAVGKNKNGQCNVSDWTNIVAIACGGDHTMGLRSDGTVVAVGLNDNGQCNVKSWRNIAFIDAGSNHSLGGTADGDIVAAGSNGSGECNVLDW